jgi:hypothetical protein
LLRRIFEPKRNEMKKGWRGLHIEELCNLYSVPSIVRIIKLQRMRWGGRRGGGVHIGYLWKRQKERYH